MDSRLRAALLVLAFLGLSGCASCDLVEAELRYQNNRVYELEQAVCERDAEIAMLRATVTDLYAVRETPAPGIAESAYLHAALSRISLGITTGGKDSDHDGRDDAIQAMLVPHDYDGDAFKCPGVATLTLYEIMPTGIKEEIGAWQFEGDALRQTWRSTLLGQGYLLLIPYDQPPSHQKLRLVARFETEDGRAFEAERDVEIAPAPQSAACVTEEWTSDLAELAAPEARQSYGGPQLALPHLSAVPTKLTPTAPSRRFHAVSLKEPVPLLLQR